MGAPKTKKRLPWTLMLFLAVLGLVLAVNGVHVLGRLLVANVVQRTVAKEGFVAVESGGEALFLRREHILITPQVGVWNPMVTENQKVVAGTEVGEVWDPVLLGQAQQLQEEVKTEKAAWESMLYSERQGLICALEEANENIQQLLSQLKKERFQAQPPLQQNQTDKLQILLSERDRLITEKEKIDRRFASGGQWRQVDAKVKKLMAEAVIVVVSPLSGRFHGTLDGYEDVFDPLEYRVALAPLIPNISSDFKIATAGELTPEGTVVGKIVQEQPTFARVNLEGAFHPIKVGEQVDLSVPGVPGQLTAIIKALVHQPKKSVVLLELNSVPPELAIIRQCEVRIICKHVQGVVIPKECLSDKKDRQGVYRWQENKWIFTPVQVLALEKGQAVVSGLKPGDEIAVGLW
ncbi:MAG TPA: HlyD family efflux transporter periplasmic adaptor subunit [bacterium]|jgi:hypothetical protein|nr:HlyD family efflux transporter periplasmic adaptor subunit [bacterium]